MCAGTLTAAVDTVQMKRVQRGLRRELPSFNFDDEVIEYLASTLDEGLSEDDLVEHWSPFLISSGACKDEDEAKRICSGLLLHLQSENKSTEPAIFLELDPWLEELQLGSYAEQARAWCESAGARNLDHLLERWQDFAAELKLKPLEKRRVEKQAAKLAAALTASCRRPGTFGPPEDPARYVILEEIGQGATATVHRCQRGDEVFAVKSISLAKLRLQPDFSRRSDKLHMEVSILCLLQHPRIVTLYDVIEEPDKALHLVMELVEGGDLFARIVRLGSFSEALAAHIFLQVVEGLSFIHSKDIVHRDLKPENILVDEQHSQGGLLEVKLSDFGHSKLINDGYSTAKSTVGTPQYWAPEVSDPSRAALGYDQTADLWSLGVLLYVMLIGAYPFHGGADRTEQIRKASFKCRASGRDISEPAKDLIRSLIKSDTTERLSLGKCLKHPWVAMAVRDTPANEPKLPRALEVRIPLPRQPSKDQVRRLRVDLANWATRFRFSAAVKHLEVIVNYGDAAQADQRNVDVAHQTMQDILGLHFGAMPSVARPN